MEIQIKGTAYNIRYTIRAMFVFEQITGKVFRLENLTDYYLFYYSLLVANNPDLQMTFEDFINECDDEPALVIQLQDFLSKEMEKQSAFICDTVDSKKVTISELYALIVLEAGITPDYFLDSMQMYEVKAILENLQYKNKTGWEQARMISYIIAQTNSTKQLSPTDIMKFDWDEAKEKDTSISKDDIARLQAKANQFINTQN
ncbi:hypothetical protein BJP75_00012650 [Bacteroides thetaiotaomicron]|nr:hypothetical protein [Bacteroides thetaiotaomicron]